MRFYTTNHKHSCGIDLHAKTMYVCILNREGKVLLHRNLKTDPELFSAYHRAIPRRPRRGCRVHVHMVLARGPMCSRKYSFCPRSRLVHEGHPRRKSKERPYRCVQDRDHSPRGDVSLLLCLPRRMAFDARPASKTASNGPSSWPTDVPRPKHPSPIQSTHAQKANRLSSQPTRGGGAIHRCQRIQERRDRPRAHGPLR